MTENTKQANYQPRNLPYPPPVKKKKKKKKKRKKDTIIK